MWHLPYRKREATANTKHAYRRYFDVYSTIQRSPQYSSGFALRFARISRIRDDKNSGQATTLAELRVLYERQFTSKSRLDL